MRWMGPADFKTPQAESEAHVGGRYRFVMLSPDGEQRVVRGVYREVVANQKLVFTWAWETTPDEESLVTVEFKPDGDGTLLTLIHEQFANDESRDGHNRGWNGALDKLERLFA
jgi:uncharacterized protein YndB with AHSA1/START domain